MLIKQLLEVYDVLDDSNASGETVEAYLRGIRKDADIHVYPLVGPKGKTDMVKVRIHGSRGKTSGGDAPTLGLLGRLGGLGARPERIGFVSDGDGALVALSLAAKLLICRIRATYWRVTSLYPLMCVPTRLQGPTSRWHLWIHLWRWPRSTRKS